MPDAMAKGLSDEFLGDLPTGSKIAPSPSMYVGGGSSEHSTASCTAVVAFESAGWSDMKQAMLSTVVSPPSPPLLPQALQGPCSPGLPSLAITAVSILVVRGAVCGG